MIKEQPNYYSILTSEVRYDDSLNDSEKILFSEITALANKNGECWATNSYFADLYHVSISTIQRRISKLKKRGYISIKIIYKKGTKEVEKRILKLCNIPHSKIETTPCQNCDDPHSNFAMTPHSKIDKENNTSIEYYKMNNKTPIVPLESEHQEVEPFDIFWNAYPRHEAKDRAKKSFKSKVTNEQILQSILDDLEKRKKYNEWIKENGKYIPYPATYLNQERWNDEYQIHKTEKDKWQELLEKARLEDEQRGCS